MNSKKQGLPGAMSYSTSAASFQNKSLIGAVERDGSCVFIYDLYSDFSCQCNQYHRTLSNFYRSIGMNDADMLPFHLFYFEGDMAAFLGNGKTAARIIYLGKFYDFYFVHIYKNGG